MTSPYIDRRLSHADRRKLLEDVLSRITKMAAEPAQRPIVVFDLDGTLMDNRPRVVAILHELAETWRERHPEAAGRAKDAHYQGIVYGFVENLLRLGIEDPQLHDDAFGFWKERFFADPHIRHDVAVPGALSFARACYGAGARLVYLTGRDGPNMSLGTFASLRDLGFPIGELGTELVTKPSFDMPDADFKRGVAPELSRFGTVVASFDNEPVNCNIFAEAHPTATHVFLDTQHAPNPPPLREDVAVVESFSFGA